MLTTAAGVAIAGRVLAPHAGRVAGRIASRLLYRVRVTRYVRRRAQFDFPTRHYRRWLKTLTKEDLESPFEVSGSELSIRLDQHLSARSDAWSGREDSLSRALDLVEATFMAVLKVEDEPRYRELAEAWQRSRNTEVIERLAATTGGYAPGLSAADRSIWLMRRSDARRKDRLGPFGIEPDQIGEALARIGGRVPSVPAETVLILVGGFGSGKSEMAEHWHRCSIEQYGNDPQGPLPVWLHARTVVAGGGLDRAIAAELGSAHIRSGVQLVLDGLDEVDGIDAEALVRDLRVFIAGSSRSSALATTRPNVVTEGQDAYQVPTLPADEARLLVEAIAGTKHATWRWSPDLQKTIESPFFALAAGSQLASEGQFGGEADLIVGLVEQALRQGRGQVATGNSELFGLLKQSAVELTGTGGVRDGLTFSQREQLRFTRLVVFESSNLIRFALPIFEQWFTAQALLSDPQLLEAAVDSPSAFDRWRWSVAIAVLAADDHVVDALVAGALKKNPGVGSWIIGTATKRPRWGGQSDGSAIAQSEAQRRLLTAVRVWVTALGDLAPQTLPVSSTRAPIYIGIRVEGRRVDLGWATDPVDTDKCVLLPHGVHPLVSRSHIPRGWIPMYSGEVDPGPLWTWSLIRRLIAGRILPMLNGESLIGPEGGVWDRERMWRAARILCGSTDLRHRPLATSDVSHAVNEALDRLRTHDGNVKYSAMQVGRRVVPGRDLLNLQTFLRGSDLEFLQRPVPAPDNERPNGGWVTDLYSQGRLVEFCSETMGLACQAYDEAASTVFSNFGWSLGTGAGGPFGIVGAVDFTKRSGRLGDQPLMHFAHVPMEVFDGYIGREDGLTVSDNGRAAFWASQNADSEWIDVDNQLHREARMWAEGQPIDSPFWSPWSGGSSGIDVQHERPASLRAAGWLFGDLRRVSLGEGTFPNFRD